MCQIDEVGFPLNTADTFRQSVTNATTIKNERGLLNYFVAMLHRIDPDVYVGHNFSGFGLDVLQNRLKENKTDFWSRLGRMRRTGWPRATGHGGGGEVSRANKELVSGRLLCDTFWLGKNYIKSSNYSLATLATTVLNTTRPDVDMERIVQYYDKAEDLLWLVQHTENDAYLSMRLAFQIMMLPLTKQLTNLAGNLWNRTLTTGRSDCNEHLLLHEFVNNGYIVPDKFWNAKEEKLST